MHEDLSDGRSFSLPNMPYDLNRKSLGIEADRPLTAARVPFAATDHEWRGRPSLIR